MSLMAEMDRTRKIGTSFGCAVPIIGAGGDRDVQETIAHILSRNGVRACCLQCAMSRSPKDTTCASSVIGLCLANNDIKACVGHR